jgi:hypothetical protein
MMVQRTAFGCFGLAVLALVLFAVRAGWYPSHGARVTRADNPISFWGVMALGVLFGAVFLILAVVPSDG